AADLYTPSLHDALPIWTAEEVLGTTKVSFRGEEIDLAPPWRRVRFVDALDEHGLWTRDEDELRRRLQERDVDVSHDPTWAKLVRSEEHTSELQSRGHLV